MKSDRFNKDRLIQDTNYLVNSVYQSFHHFANEALKAMQKLEPKI